MKNKRENRALNQNMEDYYNNLSKKYNVYEIKADDGEIHPQCISGMLHPSEYFARCPDYDPMNLYNDELFSFDLGLTKWETKNDFLKFFVPALVSILLTKTEWKKNFIVQNMGITAIPSKLDNVSTKIFAFTAPTIPVTKKLVDERIADYHKDIEEEISCEMSTDIHNVYEIFSNLIIVSDAELPEYGKPLIRSNDYIMKEVLAEAESLYEKLLPAINNPVCLDEFTVI